MAKDEDIPADPAQFDEAVEKFRARVPMTRAAWEKLTEGQREHAFFVSEVATADLVTEVYDAIERAIAAGTTLEEFQATAGQALIKHWGGDKPGRLETIFRTNVQTAYNGGRHAILSAPTVRRARPYLRFDAILDDRVTDVCEDLDGKVIEADDAFWKTHTPPLHFNCRSVVTPLTEEEAAEEGITDQPPDTDPHAGFGTPPAIDGPDWTPDLTAYPDEIRVELEARLKKGAG